MKAPEPLKDVNPETTKFSQYDIALEQAASGDADGLRRTLDSSNIKESLKPNLIRIAAEKGHADALTAILKRTDRQMYTEVLNSASEYGQVHIVKSLFEQHAPIDHATNRSLSLSSRKGKLNVVKFLIESGTDVHMHDDDAILDSAINGHFVVFLYLIEQGANWNANGQFIMKHCDSRFVQHLVLEYGADPNLSIDSFSSPQRS